MPGAVDCHVKFDRDPALEASLCLLDLVLVVWFLDDIDDGSALDMVQRDDLLRHDLDAVAPYGKGSRVRLHAVQVVCLPKLGGHEV